MYPHDHPSTRPTRPVPSEAVARAIDDSIQRGGAETRIEFTDAAVLILREEAEREDDDTYTFHGIDCDGRKWRVALFD